MQRSLLVTLALCLCVSVFADQHIISISSNVPYGIDIDSEDEILSEGPRYGVDIKHEKDQKTFKPVVVADVWDTDGDACFAVIAHEQSSGKSGFCRVCVDTDPIHMKSWVQTVVQKGFECNVELSSQDEQTGVAQWKVAGRLSSAKNCDDCNAPVTKVPLVLVRNNKNLRTANAMI
eukprot:GILI01006772.1.p2 GENE.GILI01006772.1~~GILI01006772.1.p2  ORF type:complete len:176 (+),score=51.62 GILI01006772.1:100-627(+)